MSVLFDYIPTPSALFVPSNSTHSPSEKTTDLKLIETNDDSSVVIIAEEKSSGKTSLKINDDHMKSNEKLIKTDSETRSINGNRRNGRSNSSNRRAFPLYPNCMSDWDSTDSESGLNESNPTEENESSSTRITS